MLRNLPFSGSATISNRPTGPEWKCFQTRIFLRTSRCRSILYHQCLRIPPHVADFVSISPTRSDRKIIAKWWFGVAQCWSRDWSRSRRQNQWTLTVADRRCDRRKDTTTIADVAMIGTQRQWDALRWRRRRHRRCRSHRHRRRRRFGGRRGVSGDDVGDGVVGAGVDGSEQLVAEALGAFAATFALEIRRRQAILVVRAAHWRTKQRPRNAIKNSVTTGVNPVGPIEVSQQKPANALMSVNVALRAPFAPRKVKGWPTISAGPSVRSFERLSARRIFRPRCVKPLHFHRRSVNKVTTCPHANNNK